MTWDAPEELESYIKKVQAAAEKLTTENRRLRKSHLTVCDKVWNLTHWCNYFYKAPNNRISC